MFHKKLSEKDFYKYQNKQILALSELFKSSNKITWKEKISYCKYPDHNIAGSIRLECNEHNILVLFITPHFAPGWEVRLRVPENSNTSEYTEVTTKYMTQYKHNALISELKVPFNLLRGLLEMIDMNKEADLIEELYIKKLFEYKSQC